MPSRTVRPTDNVVTALACSLYGEERLVTPVPGTRFASWVPEPFVGMHFCNYAPTVRAVAQLEAAGVVVGATAPDAGAEVLDFPDHPFYVTVDVPAARRRAGRRAGAPAGAGLHGRRGSRGPCVKASRAAPRSVRRSIAPRTPPRPARCLRGPAGLADPRCGPRGGPGRRTAAVAAAVLRRGPAPVRRGRRGRGRGPRGAAGRGARCRPGHVRLPAPPRPPRGCASTRSTSRPPVRGSGSGSPRRGSKSRTR